MHETELENLESMEFDEYTYDYEKSVIFSHNTGNKIHIDTNGMPTIKPHNDRNKINALVRAFDRHTDRFWEFDNYINQELYWDSTMNTFMTAEEVADYFVMRDFSFYPEDFDEDEIANSEDYEEVLI